MSKSLKLTVFLIMIFAVVMNVVFAPSNIISWDVYGYYLYLPATFIYHDLALINDQLIMDLMEQYTSSATFYQAVKMPSGEYVMKYSMGMAILYAPFFFIGYLISLVTPYASDGFSLPFQVSLWASGVVVQLVGIWYTAKVLGKLFDQRIAIVVLGLTVFATNYMVHTMMYGQNAMSQNYLFTLYTLLLWLTLKWHESYQPKFMYRIGVLLGLMALSRPTEIIAVIIPLLWGISTLKDIPVRIELFWKHRLSILVTGFIVVGIGGLQLIYWKVYSGKFIFNSYGANAGEGLELLRPFTKQFLFSFRKGWLVYTPIMVFALIGAAGSLKRHKAYSWAIFVFTVINIYLISSWSNWWYAQSFSQRAMVSSYPILAIGLAYFIEVISESKKLKWVGYFLLMGTLVLNIFQTIQYHKGIIHGDRMTWPYYKAIWGSLEFPENAEKLMLINRSFDGNYVMADSANYKLDTVLVSKMSDYMDAGNPTEQLIGMDRTHSGVVEAPVLFNNNFTHEWIKVQARIFVPENAEPSKLSLISCFMHNGFGYAHKYHSVSELKTNDWNELGFWYLTPEPRIRSNEFRAFLACSDDKPYIVDWIKAEVYSPIYDPR